MGSIFIMKKEAYLFDAKLYILKAFVAVLTAYAIVHPLPMINKDMISVLFGLMLTLEPVTVTGIRSGWNQLVSTFLGAFATAVIITFFGINMWTVAISVSATLFLCLKINWREVSPVAIFTSIYMTQFVQYSANGMPSVFLTFRLRIFALGTGILVAVFYNFLFSLFFYKQMEKKRVIHILETLSSHMIQMKKVLEGKSLELLLKQKEQLPATFLDIDWLFSLLKDKEKEERFRKKVLRRDHSVEIIAFQDTIIALRSITHLSYDSVCQLEHLLMELSEEAEEQLQKCLDCLVEVCSSLIKHEPKKIENLIETEHWDLETKMPIRLNENLNDMRELLVKIAKINIENKK